MEYLITTKQSFDEIEALTIGALEQEGLAVQGTFSLRSAVSLPAENVSDTRTAGRLGYSLFMLYEPGAARMPLGLLTIYEREGRTVISLVLTTVEDRPTPSAGSVPVRAPRDADDALVTALVSSGLEFCLVHANGDRCISAEELAKTG